MGLTYPTRCRTTAWLAVPKGGQLLSSRRDSKDQRRRERLEAERRAQQQRRRRHRWQVSGLAAAGIILIVLGVVVLLGGTGGESSDVFDAKPEGLQRRLEQARLPLGGDHIHPVVRVVVNGEPIPIPDDIGTAADGRSHSPIHRHPGDEVLHAEGVEDGRFTLGQFMQVWGVELSRHRLGPYRAQGDRRVTVLAKWKGAKRFQQVNDFAGLELGDGDEVYIVYGTPDQSPIVL